MTLNNDKIKHKFLYFNLEKLVNINFITLDYYLDFENQSYNYIGFCKNTVVWS